MYLKGVGMTKFGKSKNLQILTYGVALATIGAVLILKAPSSPIGIFFSGVGTGFVVLGIGMRFKNDAYE